MSQVASPNAGGRTPPSRVTLIALTAVSVLTLNLFLPSLPSMARDFGVSYATISLSIAGYLFLSAALILILGPIADRYGRRPVLLVCFAVFTLASVGAALSQSFWVFLLFRSLQALCATGSTLSRAIVRDMLPPGPAASLQGYIAMAMAIAPMIGPLIGGLMEETLGWRSVFWGFGVLGTLCLALIWFDLGETAPGKGMALSERIRGYREVLHSRRFWGYTGVIAFSTGAFFVFLAGAPFVAERVFGLAPSKVGMAIGTTAVGFFFGSMIAGRLAAHVPLILMMVRGRVIALVGPVVALVLAVSMEATPLAIFACLVLIGVGNGIALPSANTGAMSVRPELAASASGLSGALATFSGGVLSVLTGAVLFEAYALVTFLLLIAMTCAGALICAYWTGREEAARGNA